MCLLFFCSLLIAGGIVGEQQVAMLLMVLFRSLLKPIKPIKEMFYLFKYFMRLIINASIAGDSAL